MKFEAVWTSIVQVFNVLTFSSPGEGEVSQIPLTDSIPASKDVPFEVHYSNDDVVPLRTGGVEYSYMSTDGPIVGTPKNPQDGAGGGLNCHYPAMPEFEPCFSPENRGCWLKSDTRTIDINTDYEDPDLVPKGKVRNFYLEVSEQPISPDGTTMEHGKVFNRTYPGPWIEACWGDTLNITVKNNLRYNGTSVHWHGIRQFESFHHDGVNGITECPIAPGDTFTYTFRALQYGSAWYHSHYSLQYGDGMLGPMTIYGPSTANFSSDAAFRPLLLTDWNHRSVFEDWPIMLDSGEAPQMTNILINGTGQFGWGPKVEKYTLWLNQSQSHMLILVNTAVDTTFVFSVDDHILEVIEMDFVPIVPYTTDHLKIGIGQRYHILIRGLDNPYEAERYGNYWMRAVPARKCSKFAFGPDEQMGIIRYNQSLLANASLHRPDPLSEPPLYDINCADEPYDKLKPWRPWTVGNPVNINPDVEHSALPNNTRYIFDVGMTKSGGPNTSTPYIPDDEPYTRWDMHIAPFRVNFSDPTLLALDRLDELIQQPHLDVITLPDATEDQWIWLVITAPDKIPSTGGRTFFPAAHPMHLHGHDFALLRQSSDNWYDDAENPSDLGDSRFFGPGNFTCDNPLLKCDNPPRRDVVLLPATGYVIIAFKADNPGAWIIHCHIAFHASSGLAMQIIENKERMKTIMESDKPKVEEACRKWRDWHANPMNLWDWNHPKHFQDDSGV
ncbi:multicopper oxidase-domain-containing protein [Bombardia bombarda]|uniref:Multicopper oxidase-domain-containing protein n=1 Tax=Bombardia bombarda TaxID=252184 RepID=A0AA40CFN5_9PEZI|nr:multicopper oxidase-domain-containing protein [Bombardia bombarda]